MVTGASDMPLSGSRAGSLACSPSGMWCIPGRDLMACSGVHRSRVVQCAKVIGTGACLGVRIASDLVLAVRIPVPPRTCMGLSGRLLGAVVTLSRATLFAVIDRSRSWAGVTVLDVCRHSALLADRMCSPFVRAEGMLI